MSSLITLEMYLTSSGKYPDRAKSPECDANVRNNAGLLLLKVNALLSELGVTKAVISSGFRTSAANDATSNAAKKSNHLAGKAVDIEDNKDQTLCKKITKALLEKHDLYREDSDSTKGNHTNWIHLQTTKTSSGNRIFKP